MFVKGDAPVRTDGSEKPVQEKPSPSSSRSGETTARNSDDEAVVDVQPQGVDVNQAKKEFGELQRNLTRRSSLSRQRSRASEPNFDPEKGGDHGEEFDLLEYLVCVIACGFGAVC